MSHVLLTMFFRKNFPDALKFRFVETAFSTKKRYPNIAKI